MFHLSARARTPEEGRICLDLGFNLLEITLPCPGGEAEEKYWADLAEDNEVRFLAHGPEEGNPRDLTHLENNYLPRLQAALEAGARLKCLGLTIHFWQDSRHIPHDIFHSKIELLSRVASWPINSTSPSTWKT